MGDILTSQRSQGDAGYFRIGTLILDIPPEKIQCHKVTNDQEVQAMRMPFSIPVQTGQSRWDVTWTWKAIINPAATNPYADWSNIQTLLAMFKAAPFVEVENEHIRQIVNPADLTPGSTVDDVMAFALRQMRVDTVPDFSDTLQVTMTMSLFNYHPYSLNFQYANTAGIPVSSAYNSNMFQTYLAAWIAANLNTDPTVQPTSGQSVSTDQWLNQTPGTITFTAREYIAVALPQNQNPPQGSTNITAANPGATVPGTSTQGVQSGFVDNVVIPGFNSIALSQITSNSYIQAWIQSAAAAEGAGYNTPNKGMTTSAFGLLQWVRQAAIEAMQHSDTYLGTNYMAIAQQTGYLVADTAAATGYSWNNQLPGSANQTPLSPIPITATYWAWMNNPPAAVTGGNATLQNNMAAAWAYALLVKYNGDVLQSWLADRFGGKNIANGTDTTADDNRWFTVATNTWIQTTGMTGAFQPTTNTTSQAGAGAPSIPPISGQVTSGTNSNANPSISANTNPINLTTVPMTPMIQYLLGPGGYIYDYATEAAAFLYKEHWLKLANQEDGDIPASSDISNIDPSNFVEPIQISVIFMNNIAQLPLANYQYPTYQHLGPVSTLISIGMLSTAKIQPATDIYPEPEHTGVTMLSAMSNLLQNQYQRLRNEWRRVNSIHRMQSMAIKNQVLNLLGIRGLLTKELTTETVSEAANVITVQYNATQYEDIYAESETPQPFQFVTVPAAVGQQWLTVLTNGSLNQFIGNQSLNTLTNLSMLMQQQSSAAPQGTPAAQQFLYNWLVPGSPSPPNAAYAIQSPTPFQANETALMLKIINENANVSGADIESTQYTETAAGIPVIASASFANQYPELATTIQQHQPLLWSDFFIISNFVNQQPGLPDYQNFQTIENNINQRIQTALTAAPSMTSPLMQLWTYYVSYAEVNNVDLLTDQMVQAQQTPQLSPLFTTAEGAMSPGSLPVNNTHGSYRDLGITTVQLGGRDFNPAMYFYDDNKALNGQLQSQLTGAVTATQKTAQAFAQANPTADAGGLQISNTQSFGGNVSGIYQNTELTQYSMSHAFPTFKLFLIEDQSNRPFYAYDQFTSYASVIDIEIIRYRDKPDTAVIQISNLMHLLDQHLFDDTPQGIFEQKIQSNQLPILPSAAEALTANGGVGQINLQTSPGGYMYKLDNRFSQLQQFTNGSDPKFPLKYFALQTGTKIQVRMGFANNPDYLVPVFTGQVTQIDGSDILTITAQSYMLELLQPSSDNIRHDGFALDSAINSLVTALVSVPRNLIHGNLYGITAALQNAFGNCPAYAGVSNVGGITIPGLITSSGDTADVMSQMLKVSNARHFGYWQPGAPTDPYLKNYTWQSALGSILLTLTSSPLTKGATGLEAGYDRSFENILTTHAFGVDGTATLDTNGSSRGWFFESPDGYYAPEYYVPNDASLTPWTIIQDIARRYPEFILAVKQYGFPYTADATLVFGNPHDFYATRLPLPNDAEVMAQAFSQTNLFYQWWENGTSSGRAQFIAFCTTLGQHWTPAVLFTYDKAINYTGDYGTSKFNQITGLGPLIDILADELAAHIDGGGAGVFNQITQLFQQDIGGPSTTYAIVNSGVSTVGALQNLNQLIQNYMNFINQKTTGGQDNVALNARMKPVRRYHFINADNIIHNGITLNDKFYNTVRITNQQIRANQNIPSQYCRVLNADPYLVSPKNLTMWPQITNSYIQTFLRDETAKMYRGELVLMGNPDIEPFDVLIMLDPSTGITGPMEVDSVIHSFNQENGYITIVRPRAFVIVNDLLGGPLYSVLWKNLVIMQQAILGYVSNALPVAVIPGIGATSGEAAAVGTELAVGAAAVGGVVAGLAASPWIASLALLGGTFAMFWAGNEAQHMNAIGIVPMTRFQRPWVGGVQGWRIDDIMGYVATQWNYFKLEEIEPLIYSFRTAQALQLIPS